ncbi:MAG: type II secretion system protein GspM [Pseudomonadota bacterium]
MNLSGTRASSGALGPLRNRWNRLATREKTLLASVLVLVTLALLWLVLLAPSLQTLRSAPAQAKALDAQLQHMLTLQAQANALQKQAPLGYDDALRALKLATTQTLGVAAQLNVVADRANITLQGASADALAQWLAQARLNARSTPLEARLTRAATPAGAFTWSGTLVMGLPQR